MQSIELLKDNILCYTTKSKVKLEDMYSETNKSKTKLVIEIGLVTMTIMQYLDDVDF